ncbi:MAG TPA: CRISPR-associated endoribonuclease Cas6 [bacterium]|nr:CRISPR-associated endoribonuclease Cas6 [bacterium]
MRIEVILSPAAGGPKVIVPLHYNKALQGLLYHQLRTAFPKVHEGGWESSGRVFRMFVFSRLMGRIEKIQDKEIHFQAPVRFFVASPNSEVIEVLADGFLKTAVIRLGDAMLELEKLSVCKTPDLTGGQVLCRAMSPVTVYSTVKTADGRKKTYYYHPQEAEFAQLVENNLRKKAQALEIPDVDQRPICLQSARVQAKDQKVVFYGRTVVKGWLGRFHLSGDPTMLKLALNAGIGAKNSQGFGMLQLIK